MANRNQPILQLDAPGFGLDTLAYEPGKLHAVELDAREGISMPFALDLTVDTTHQTISPGQLLLKPVSLNVRRGAEQQRFFHGIVSELEPTGFSWRDRFRYRLRIVPRLWFLHQVTDCRIYQNQTAEQILTRVFGEYDVGATSFRINGTQRVREYTTQYDETYLRFVSRIMQEEGLFYFFEHSEQDHTLVVANHNMAFNTIPGQLHRVTGDHRMEQEVVEGWTQTIRPTVGSTTLQDYDLHKPDTALTGEEEARSGARPVPSKGWTTYSWPGFGDQSSVLRDHAQTRMQAAEATSSLQRGEATNPNLYPGGIITLEFDPLTQESGVRYVVASTHHYVLDETWIAGRPPPAWRTEFSCFAEQATWRDELVLARPPMTGIYSAIVIGDDAEIETDAYSRIKVRPLFDHRRETRASEAIWVRVLHAWAGPSAANGPNPSPARGWQHIPRIGTEVGLAFMNGDPDDPVVVGCFYNAVAKPPFDLPGERTRQGYRSHSSVSPGGVPKYNELSFEDRNGAEQVYLRAQKDHDVVSKTGDITVTAELGSISITAETRISLRVGASSIVITPESILITAPAVINARTGGAMMVEAGGAMALTAGADLNITTSAVMTVSAPPGEIAITGGNVTITATESGIVELIEGFV